MGVVNVRCLGCGETVSSETDLVVGQHVRCPLCNAKFAYLPELRVTCPEDAREPMLVTCQHCGKTVVVDDDLNVGQHVLCPYCEKKFAYLKGGAEGPLVKAGEGEGARTVCGKKAKKLGVLSRKMRLRKEGLRPGEKKEIVLIKARFEEKARKREWERMLMTRLAACALFAVALIGAVVVYFVYQSAIDTRLVVRNALARYMSDNSHVLRECHSQYDASVRKCRNFLWKHRDEDEFARLLRARIVRFQGVQSEIEDVLQSIGDVAPRLDSMSVEELKVAQAGLTMQINSLGVHMRSIGLDVPMFVASRPPCEPKKDVRPAAEPVRSHAEKPMVHLAESRPKTGMPSGGEVSRNPPAAQDKELSQADIDMLVRRLKDLKYGFDPQALKRYGLQEQKLILDEMLDDAMMLQKKTGLPVDRGSKELEGAEVLCTSSSRNYGKSKR